MTEHDTQVMWIHSASQDFLAEATTDTTLKDGRTAIQFDSDDVNKIVKRCVERWGWKPDVVGKSWIATTVPNPAIKWCECGSKKPSYWLYDGHGIALCKACDTCKPMRLKRYRPDINTRYEADEPIDENE